MHRSYSPRWTTTTTVGDATTEEAIVRDVATKDASAEEAAVEDAGATEASIVGVRNWRRRIRCLQPEEEGGHDRWCQEQWLPDRSWRRRIIGCSKLVKVEDGGRKGRQHWERWSELKGVENWVFEAGGGWRPWSSLTSELALRSVAAVDVRGRVSQSVVSVD